ncbi:MAG TPA: hypothetical protein VFJ85_01115 [Acidimicrobiales bacterium]|nr:hypothetical protein [Acidimicrobiales bacterium]
MRRGASTPAIVATLVAGAVLVAVGTAGGTRTTTTSPPSAVPAGPVPATSPPPVPSVPPAAPEPVAAPAPPPQELAAQLERTDRLERDVPLVRALPHEAATYRIDYRLVDDGLVLVVTLAPPLNRAEQLPQRQAQLAAAKREALEYLASQHAPPGIWPIEYLPPEAEAL